MIYLKKDFFDPFFHLKMSEQQSKPKQDLIASIQASAIQSEQTNKNVIVYL